MNGISLLVGLPAIGVAIGLFVYVLASSRKPAVAATGDASVRTRHHAQARREGRDLESLTRRLARLAAKLMPANYAARLQHRLDLAGNPRAWTADRLLAIKGIGVVAGAALGFLLGVKHGLALALLLTAAVGVVGLFMPDLIVRNLGERRQLALQRGLPDAMDMLTVCVEAGLGFDAALGRVARHLSGPVAEECARVLQEMQVGLSRTEALRALSGRTTVVELRGFVSAMVQAAELGISIGDVLREQSKEMRIRRRQRAEERAQKLQVKLLFPLICCLLPAMFIVLLGPAGIKIMSFFAKAN